ncbi:MAG: Calx-beta domain protein [Verrucomicrobiales bacterium]|nr:Calx-beta domain protein [Verrucomicrobiales bacterium]
MMTQHTYRWGMRAIVLSFVWFLSTLTTNAAPYACDLTNNAGVISFRLNEDAQNVKIITATSTNDLGALPKGVTTTANLGIVGVYKVAVTRSAAAGYALSSNDSATNSNGVFVNRFFFPRGVVVNKNPATPSFGRIYVANAKAGTTTTSGNARLTDDGIFALNSDDTVALDTETSPKNAGITFDSASTDSASPARLTIGKDDNQLYMSDFSDPHGGLWTSDLDLNTGINVLAQIGDTLGANHGSIYAAAVEGSLANGNLKVFTVDEDLPTVKSSWRYDVNAGPLPFAGGSNSLGQTLVNSTVDLVKGGANGYLYVSQNRSAGADPGVRVFDANGNSITNSLTTTRQLLGNPTAADILRNVTALDLSPDGKTLAVLQGVSFGRILFVPLTNGILDLVNTNSLQLGVFSDSVRDITYDAAGNIYIVYNIAEWLRIYSRGGPTLITTGSDGTIQNGIPATLVTVTATVATALEGSATNGIFTFSRSDATSALTVNYTMSGTANNGVDYVTVATNVTFGVGQTNATVTVTPINNGIAEFTRTATLTITSSGAYAAGVPNSATVSILDDESPVLSMVPVQTAMLEGYSASKASFQLIRKGQLTPLLNANISYTGSGLRGTHFTAPATVTMAVNVVTNTLTITPIDDTIYSGDKRTLVQLSAGTGYTVDVNNAGVISIVEDDLPVSTNLFSDNFNTPSSDTSATWNIFSLDSFNDSHVTFGYNYTNVFVPTLQGAADTLALKLQCSTNTAITNDSYAISISPQSLDLGTNDYRMSFKMWINYNGPMFDGGPGSTYHMDAGVGTTGDHLNSPAGDGVSFSVDGDGGADNTFGDLAARSGGSLQPFDSGVYAAGTDANVRMTTNPFYSLWGGLTAPAAQLAAFPSQSGTQQPGNMGMSWHTVTVSKTGGIVTWHIDGVLIATISDAALAGNIFLGYHDSFKGPSPVGAMSFALVDNLKVQGYVAVPPATPNIFNVQKGTTNIVINFTDTMSNSPDSFTLVGSTTLSTSGASYTSVANAVITGTNGVFQATAPMVNTAQFFRIQR